MGVDKTGEYVTRTLNEYLRTENYLKDLNLDYLFSGNIGVLSPLSSDYFKTAFYREYIVRYLSPECFKLKPVILGWVLDLVAMPEEKDGNPALQDVQEIIPIVDINVSGLTRRAVVRAAKEHYPNHFIHGSAR